MATKKEVAKTDEKSTALTTSTSAVPDFMKQDAGKGVENFSAADIEVPRLVLLQALSEEVTDGDHKAGVFYHTILQEQVGEKDKPLRFIPITGDIRYILWRPRHEGGGILARADDGKHWNPPNMTFDVKPYKDRPTTVKWTTKPTVAESGLDKFGSSDPQDPNSQPAAVKMWCYVVVLPDYPEMGPMVLTFQRGTASLAKKFTGKLSGIKAPSFGQIFAAKVKKENTGSGDYYSFDIERVGFVEDADEYAHYKELNDQFTKSGINIKDLEGAQEGGQSQSSAENDMGV